MPGVLFRVQGNSVAVCCLMSDVLVLENSVAVLCQVFCSGYKGIVLLSDARCSVRGTRE